MLKAMLQLLSLSLLACDCSNVTIQLFEGNKAVNILCPGGQYTVKVRMQQSGQQVVGEDGSATAL